MKTVGIIGGSGFIGSHVTKKFLANGYKVRVSSTDISNTDKYKHLKQLPDADNLEIVQLDVRNMDQVRKFVKDCQIIVHGGTPFQLDFQDLQSELFEPTIKGTENFLEAVSASPGLEKVVFVASVAAYNTDFPMPPNGSDNSFDENDTPHFSQESHPYAQAKFMANETVNRFIADNPDRDFEITSVAPVFVVGKSLSQREDSTSSGMQFLMKGMIAPNPFVQMMYDNDVEFAMVDVKDVAKAIYKAATTSGLDGRNYLLTSESYRISDISAMLNGNEPKSPPRVFYKNDAASKDLGMNFSPARLPLNEFSN